MLLLIVETIWRQFLLGITKLWTHLHPVPSTTIRLHPPPPSPFQTPTSSFQPPSSSLQHPQQYLNQDIARNWAISPNLGRKIESCPFWLKIGTSGILQVLIPNPDLDFSSSDHKIHFCANLGPKSQSFLFSLKIGAHGISRMLILVPTFVFWISNPKLLLAKFGPKDSKFSVLSKNWHTWYLEDADSYCDISFLNFTT